jgi:hypothetical protein
MPPWGRRLKFPSGVLGGTIDIKQKSEKNSEKNLKKISF